MNEPLRQERMEAMQERMRISEHMSCLERLICAEDEKKQQLLVELKPHYDEIRSYLHDTDTISMFEAIMMMDYHDTELLELALQKKFAYHHDVPVDKLLDYAIENDYPESTVILLNYKNQNGLYEDAEKQFVL